MNRRDFIAKLPALVALAGAPGLVSARTGQVREGFVTASALNIRSGPGAYNPAIGVLHNGARVTIHDYANGWYRISSHRISGWASGSYIRPIGSGYSSDHDRHHGYPDDRYDDRRYAKPPRRRSRRRIATIGSNRWGYANMFDGPGRRYQVIARLGAGERVRVIEPGDRWTLVSRRGVGRGYVRSRFLDYY